MEHWIAKYVMKQLLTQSPAKWSELRPEGESDNLFGYYMKRLVAAGLIENKEKLWYLTEKGRISLSDISLDTMRETKTPKLCVMFAATCKDKVAVYQWQRAPYTGKFTLPYGRWHRGDTYAEAAQAELIDKAGIELPLETFAEDGAYSVDETTIHEVHVPCRVSLEATSAYASAKGEWQWAERSALAGLPWASQCHQELARTLCS